MQSLNSRCSQQGINGCSGLFFLEDNMSSDEENQIKNLEKQIEQLKFIRGITDKFGTFQSLKKDIELINYFLQKENCTRRYIELITYFERLGWSKSTVEHHLRHLHQVGVLEGGAFLGEHKLCEDVSSDMDLLIQILIGEDIYSQAKRAWKDKVNYQ